MNVHHCWQLLSKYVQCPCQAEVLPWLSNWSLFLTAKGQVDTSKGSSGVLRELVQERWIPRGNLSRKQGWSAKTLQPVSCTLSHLPQGLGSRGARGAKQGV